MPRYSAWVMCSGSGGRFTNVAIVNITDRIEANVNLKSVYSTNDDCTLDKIVGIPTNAVASARGINADMSVNQRSKCKLLITTASTQATVLEHVAYLKDRQDYVFSIKVGKSMMLPIPD